MEGYDRMRLAVLAMLSEKTVRRVYRGYGTAYSRARVKAAAESLGLPPPPERSSLASLSLPPEPAKTSPTR